ncbi:DUF4097 domain-containing protein [Luteimonas sp. SX5]|uniref:DUF4097 domain-containing protein n=1 Tax=Luteimonas galliterrae TaxID=2940486 RepID=A0ABT0MF17_9GAMM|nr:DUF4097 family beta strand repeat-containing protein [Luteimonas galliterrae]MCL1633467.1 DUF4097 domain-containing protein [Luteimonas galliterrae]
MKLQMLTLALLAGLSAPAWAAKPIDQTHPLNARGTVSVENVKGRIEVRVWDKPEVHIGGSLGDGVERFEVDGDRDRLDIEVKYPNNSRNSEPTTLILKVPTLASLNIDGVAVDIDVVGTAGAELSIDSVSGNVAVAGAPGEADIESVSGDVRVTLNSANVSVQSVSGNIDLRGRLNGDIETETVSGDLQVDTRGERVRNVSASSVSGDITIRSGLADGGRIGTESVSGDITLIMPKSLSARVSGESFSGDLSAPGASVNRAKYGPGSDFEQRYGSGNGDIRIETFSGTGKLELN